MECIICRSDIDVQDFGDGKIWEDGHNAWPVEDGRCCTECNENIVTPKRYKDHYHNSLPCTVTKTETILKAFETYRMQRWWYRVLKWFRLES